MQAEPLFIGRHFDEADEDHSELTGFSRRRDSAIQRSQDSGALTDWSGSRGSPTRQSCDSLEEPAKYVTVLSVNGGLDLTPVPSRDESSDYVTVVSIGKGAGEEGGGGDDDDDDSVVLGSGVCLSLAGFVEEVVGISRKPGQKLGFGLKFDGGVEPETLVRRLFIQCCAESSPASGVRCSWGRLVEADEIIEIDGLDIRNRLGRLQVVNKLTDGQEVLTLKIRHYWDEKRRSEIMRQLNAGGSPRTEHRAETKSAAAGAKKGPPVSHERAVDVPDELLRQSSHSIARSSSLEPAPAANSDDLAPPVPPPRRKKSKAVRSLSSDLVTGGQATWIVSIPSKPPRKPLKLSPSFAGNVAVLLAPEPAQVYVNLIADEDKRLLSDAGIESESDANSSVSTVVDARSIAGPFSETGESRETREQQPEKAHGGPCGESIETEPGTEAVLAVLIQPPETFLDQHPASISPNSNQDASSDSGASSGGSELHHTESDEELRFFQQMESVVESGEDCNAILWPAADSRASSRATERQDDEPIHLAALPADGADVRREQPDDLSIARHARPEGKEEKVEHVVGTKANANRAVRSRIPQAVSSSPNRSLVKNPAAGSASSRAARATASYKSASGAVATPAKSVTSPPRHNAPASRVATARSTSNVTKPVIKPAPSAGSALLKSVKSGLAGSQQLSKIPRPSQPSKSGPAPQLARPRPPVSSSSSSSSSTTMLPRTGVRGATQLQLKSPNRALLTHANKGESASRSDLLSAR